MKKNQNGIPPRNPKKNGGLGGPKFRGSLGGPEFRGKRVETMKSLIGQGLEVSEKASRRFEEGDGRF